MKYYVVDTVDIHEREIDDARVAGLPLKQQALMIDAYDVYKCDPDLAESTSRDPCSSHYEEKDGIGKVWGDTDGHGHYYGIVIGLPGTRKVRLAARRLLQKLTTPARS